MLNKISSNLQSNLTWRTIIDAAIDKVNSMDSIVTELQSNVGDYESDITQINSTLATIQSDLGTAESDIVALENNQIIVGTSLPGSPTQGRIYILTTAATVYPKGVYIYDGTGWVCVQQYSDIALANWTSAAVSLTLVPGVLYTVTATAAPASLAIGLETSGEVTIIKTGAYALPEPTVGKYLTENGLDALANTLDDVQIIVEKTGSTIIYSAASVISL